MTKKEFKKKCKKEKTLSYKLMLSGEILSVIGFVIVVLTILFIKKFEIEISGCIIGGIIAFIGMVLDLFGEGILAKEYKQYKQCSY